MQQTLNKMHQSLSLRRKVDFPKILLHARMELQEKQGQQG